MRTPNVELQGATILVTGAAGFIGSSLVKRLLRTVPSIQVVGFDNVNDYYSTALKEYRLAEIQREAEKAPGNSWRFIKGDITSPNALDALCSEYGFDVIVHLAAQAGVRHSLSNPEAYIESNLVGFFRLLEACRKRPPAHLVYASSSSVYGANRKEPYEVNDKTDSPVSLYAATKKSNELMAYAYSSLYQIPSTGLRFFTVYGPAGRPDMAYFSFTDRLRKGEKIQLFNYGKCKRDFTYIDDIVEGIVRVMSCAPEREPSHTIYNIGNHTPVELLDFMDILHEELICAGVLPGSFHLEDHIVLAPPQPGDVLVTCADVAPLKRDFGFSPSTPLRIGLRRFAEWYRDYYL